MRREIFHSIYLYRYLHTWAGQDKSSVQTVQFNFIGSFLRQVMHHLSTQLPAGSIKQIRDMPLALVKILYCITPPTPLGILLLRIADTLSCCTLNGAYSSKAMMTYFSVLFQVIARLVDGSAFHEFKQLFGPTLITGFAHVDG